MSDIKVAQDELRQHLALTNSVWVRRSQDPASRVLFRNGGLEAGIDTGL